jgi:Lon protease-like protein
MGWLERLLGQEKAPPEVLEVPLFPLHSVLFPGGIMSLRVFEQRYLDMVTACMKDKRPFGVCLIAAGKEVGGGARPHPIGTLAMIRQSDMPEPGLLHLVVAGDHRFRILESQAQPDGLLRARVELLDEAAFTPVPGNLASLVPLLEQIASDMGPERLPPPHVFDDASWVGYRLSEVMPVQPLAQQKLLELTDPVSRLEILYKYLAPKGLVS